MALDIIAFSAVTALLLSGLWLLSRGRRARAPLQKTAQISAIEDLFPRHCQHFPRIQQALSEQDIEFIRQRAPLAVWRRARAERHRIVLQYLRGLREDFVQLSQLARMVAALSPAVDRGTELERLLLDLRFHGLYRLVWLRIWMGDPVPGHLRRLTELIGSLASRVETAMTTMEGHSPQAGGLHSVLN